MKKQMESQTRGEHNPASQRIDYLIESVARGNANVFATACGLDKGTVSKIRRGTGKLIPENYFPRILAAYPSISREWLYEGKGKPMMSVEWTIDDYRRENERLWNLVEQYERIVADYHGSAMPNKADVPKKVPKR